MKTWIINFILLLGTLGLTAQEASESLLYSQNNNIGTARSIGVGNAFGAIGADFSSVSINPAGLGFYRQSAFSFTPALSISNNTSSHFGETVDERGYGFGFSNIGVSFLTNKPPKTKPTGLATASVAVGFNRLNNFHDEVYISGFNTENSLPAKLASDINRSGVESLSEFGSIYENAYQSYLIDPIGNNQYNSVTDNGQIQQRELLKTKGSSNEFVIGMGFNIADRFYFGATLGVPITYYVRESTYEESDVNDNNDRFNSLTVSERLETNGFGFNGKFGGLMRINNNIRAGIAYHTPSFLRLDDRYFESMSVEAFDTDGTSVNNTDLINSDLTFNYRLKTPGRWIASLALFSPKVGGFISVDYELLNYGKSSFENIGNSLSEKSYFIAENQKIKDDFSIASNLKVGAEWARDIFRLRGGYNFLGSPLKNSSLKPATHQFSVGGGLHGRTAFADIAYVNTNSDYQYQVYQGAFPTDIENRKSTVLMTLGLKF